MDKRQKKAPQAVDKPTSELAHGGKGPAAGDAQSKVLLKASKAAGNQGLADLVKSAGGKRDALVAFITGRLKNIRDVQMKEADKLGQEDKLRQQLAQGKDHVPQPGRFAECAQYYKQALHALCAGHMHRGAQLLNKAMDAERAAMESLPEHVASDLLMGQGDPFNAPEALGNIASDEKVESRAMPHEAALADRIISMDPVAQAMGMRSRKPHDWFSEEEDEEQEGGKKKKAAEAAKS